MVETKLKYWIFLLALFFVNVKIEAHPMPNSVVSLNILKDKIQGKAQIPMRDLQSVLGENVSLEDLRSYFLAHIRPTDSEGQKWQVKIEKTEIIKATDLVSGNYQELEIDFVMIPPAEESLYQFIFDYDVVCHQVVTHKVFVLIKQAEKQMSEIIELDIPTEKIKPLHINFETQNVEGRFSKIIYAGYFLLFGVSMIILILFSKKFKLTKK